MLYFLSALKGENKEEEKTAGTIINTHKYFHKLDLKAALNNKRDVKKGTKANAKKL